MTAQTIDRELQLMDEAEEGWTLTVDHGPIGDSLALRMLARLDAETGPPPF